MNVDRKSNSPTMKRIEMKFLVDDHLSRDVQAWARDHLGVDQVGNSNGGDSYDVNTLYLDTPARDLLRGTKKVGRTKHRIRRYGDEPVLWVETKRKKKMVVRKNRTCLYESDFAADRRLVADDQRCDDWFIDRLRRRNLLPAVRLAYRRFARTTVLNGQNLRLTIDSDMYACPADDWDTPTTSRFGELPRQRFGNCEILELKFTGSMPVVFKTLLKTFTIPASGFSKYRTAMEGLSIPPRSSMVDTASLVHG